MRRYREKKKIEKGQAQPTDKQKGGQVAARKIKKRHQSEQKWIEEKLKQAEKQKAVLRTQAWRLCVKMTKKNHEEPVDSDDIQFVCRPAKECQK